MKTNEKIIVFIICILIVGIYFLGFKNLNSKDDIYNIYNVYLNGNIIGVIEDKDALYALIDEKQQTIKDKYNVKNVYPPQGLKVVETYSYNNDTQISDLNTVYNKIEEEQDFTIAGYEVNVKSNNSSTTDTSGKERAFDIYVLNKDVFTDAVKEFILSFVDLENYQSYMNGTQDSLENAGINYNDMKILEDITIREKYISVNDKIYSDAKELAQELLFGFNYVSEDYTVKEGDTIESISDENTLNVQEFLIANPRFSSKDSLLTIGDSVSVTRINPELSFSYIVYELKEVEEPFNKTVVYDSKKEPTYSEITTPGVKGLSLRQSHYTVVNGEPSSEITIDSNMVLREKVDQVTTRGKKVNVWGSQTFVDTGSGWTWPTGSPYSITSEFAPRWGKHHDGLDISGTGWGSNIYAANDGVVVAVNTGCENIGFYGSGCGKGLGNYVIIKHSDTIYTLYGHMLTNIPVHVGDVVSCRQVVGYMGSSGSSTGIHLHFGLTTNGEPFKGGTFQNPRKLFQ